MDLQKEIAWLCLCLCSDHTLCADDSSREPGAGTCASERKLLTRSVAPFCLLKFVARATYFVVRENTQQFRNKHLSGKVKRRQQTTNEHRR